jgi:hypothetical protein
VFAIKYRTTPCDQPIANQAKQVGKLAADPHAGQKPASLNCASQVTGCCSVGWCGSTELCKQNTITHLERRCRGVRSWPYNKHSMCTVAQHPVMQLVMVAGLSDNRVHHQGSRRHTQEEGADPVAEGPHVPEPDGE